MSNGVRRGLDGVLGGGIGLGNIGRVLGDGIASSCQLGITDENLKKSSLRGVVSAAVLCQENSAWRAVENTGYWVLYECRQTAKKLTRSNKPATG